MYRGDPIAGSQHLLKYSGNPKLEPAAKQMAQIISAAYDRNQVGEAGRSWSEVPPISIQITDGGAINITHSDGDIYTTGMGLVLGTVMGIGLARQKKVEIDKYGASTEYRSMSPCCAAVRFESFADLAESVNGMAKSQEEKIDVAALKAMEGKKY